MNRRQFISYLAGLSVAFSYSTKAENNTFDVVIIGAGIAGLTASRLLTKNGVSNIVLEATSQIGGRAYSETNTFGFAYDHGAMWVDSADVSPFTKIVDANTGSFIKKNYDAWLYLNQTEATDQQYQDLANAYEKIYAIDTQGTTDSAITDFYQSSNDYDKIMSDLYGPMTSGTDLSNIDLTDWLEHEETLDDRLVMPSMGSITKNMAENINISLSTPVSKIDYSKSTVKIHTSKKIFKAKKVLVTVSTGVLNSNLISFSPILPQWKQQSFASLPMGLLNKVSILFDHDFFEANANTELIHFDQSHNITRLYFLKLREENLALCFIGGDIAHKLEIESPSKSVDHCLYGLKEVYGDYIEQHIKAYHVTKWGQNQNTLGSYSYCKPGQHQQRIKLSRPIDDKLYFAGEACSPNWYSTVSGAYQSGRLAASQIMTELS